MTGAALAGALLVGLVAPSQEPLRAWAVDDGVRIDPRTGTAFEDDPIYPEALRIKPGYRDRNWIFSRDRKEVSLAGAANEVLAFQILVESGRPLRGVTVSVSDTSRGAKPPGTTRVRSGSPRTTGTGPSRSRSPCGWRSSPSPSRTRAAWGSA